MPPLHRYLRALFVVLVLLDLAFSGYQHYVMPIDGDLTPIVAPSIAYRQVLDDPLGLAVLLKNEIYAAPNRYFAHASMAGYFRHVPLALQGFVPPVDSIYLACGVFKILLNIGLLYLLTWYASGERRPRSFKFWLTAVLVAPLFQTYGYGIQMAVIHSAITYCFFYGFPLALLLVWLAPFYHAARRGEPVRLRAWEVVGLGLLALYLALHGPIVSGVVGVLFPGVVAVWVIRQLATPAGHSWLQRLLRLPARLPRPALGLGGWFGALVLYSLYIGRNNAENLTVPMPLTERYELLLLGIGDIFTGNPGLWLLALVLVINAALLRWQVATTREQQWLLTCLRWLSVFAVVYIALTPLGGFRAYRPHILRCDLMAPITLAMMALYAGSAQHLIRHLPGRFRGAYIGGVVLLAGVYWGVDLGTDSRDQYFCERRNLKRIAQSTEPIVKLSRDCNVMSWQIDNTYSAEIGAQMLYYWGVTDTLRQYQQRLY
ncbi:MAG: hypothetical protein H7330_08255 [Hymenobacteraceae bacterium]|nr:hypothetical protein [Hymenobacteraceae bacterium]